VSRDIGGFLALLAQRNPGVDVVRQIAPPPPPPQVARVVDPKEMFK